MWLCEQSTVINILFLSNIEEINSEEIDKKTIHLGPRRQSLSTVISKVMLTKSFVTDVEHSGIWEKNVISETMPLPNTGYELFNECAGVILFITHFLPTSVFH